MDAGADGRRRPPSRLIPRITTAGRWAPTQGRARRTRSWMRHSGSFETCRRRASRPSAYSCARSACGVCRKTARTPAHARGVYEEGSPGLRLGPDRRTPLSTSGAPRHAAHRGTAVTGYLRREVKNRAGVVPSPHPHTHDSPRRDNGLIPEPFIAGAHGPVPRLMISRWSRFSCLRNSSSWSWGPRSCFAPIHTDRTPSSR